MKDEIKEILDELETIAGKHTIEVREDGSKIERMSACVVNELRLNNFSSKILLDFITNLQQERDKFKSRNEKAIELIKKDREKSYDSLEKKAFYCNKTNKLLNILQGDDKDEKSY